MCDCQGLGLVARIEASNLVFDNMQVLYWPVLRQIQFCSFDRRCKSCLDTKPVLYEGRFCSLTYVRVSISQVIRFQEYWTWLQPWKGTMESWLGEAYPFSLTVILFRKNITQWWMLYFKVKFRSNYPLRWLVPFCNPCALSNEINLPNIVHCQLCEIKWDGQFKLIHNQSISHELYSLYTYKARNTTKTSKRKFYIWYRVASQMTTKFTKALFAWYCSTIK